jgi:hypothetical protein
MMHAICNSSSQEARLKYTKMEHFNYKPWIAAYSQYNSTSESKRQGKGSMRLAETGIRLRASANEKIFSELGRLGKTYRLQWRWSRSSNDYHKYQHGRFLKFRRWEKEKAVSKQNPRIANYLGKSVNHRKCVELPYYELLRII